MNWEDHFFIVEVEDCDIQQRRDVGAVRLFYIVVCRHTGKNMRKATFRTPEHAYRSVKRLMQKLELKAEKELLLRI